MLMVELHSRNSGQDKLVHVYYLSETPRKHCDRIRLTLATVEFSICSDLALNYSIIVLVSYM